MVVVVRPAGDAITPGFPNSRENATGGGGGGGGSYAAILIKNKNLLNGLATIVDHHWAGWYRTNSRVLHLMMVVMVGDSELNISGQWFQMGLFKFRVAVGVKVEH